MNTATTPTLTGTEDKSGLTPAAVSIIGTTSYATRSYEILIGYVKNGELPQYVVRNLETKVIEFNHEVLSFAREWIAHFQARLDALDAGKNPDATPTTPAQFN